MGNFRRMKAGEPWSVTEPTARAIIESAEYWAQHNNDPGDVDSPDYLFEGTIVQVRNDSGTAQNRFSVMGLAGALINDQQNLQEFKNYPRFSVVTPSTSYIGMFCVLVEPLNAGAMGRALVSGVCPVMIQPLPASAQEYMYADISPGQSGYLVERNWGSAEILWYNTGGTGTCWALVRISQPESVIRFVLTANLNACGSAGANILGINPDLSQYQGGAITVSDPLGVVNGQYLAIYNGCQLYMPAGSTGIAKYFNDSGLFEVLQFGQYCGSNSCSGGSSGGSSGSSGTSGGSQGGYCVADAGGVAGGPFASALGAYAYKNSLQGLPAYKNSAGTYMFTFDGNGYISPINPWIGLMAAVEAALWVNKGAGWSPTAGVTGNITVTTGACPSGGSPGGSSGLPSGGSGCGTPGWVRFQDCNGNWHCYWGT